MKDIGVHVGYTFLWDRVSKLVRAGMQMCYYLASPPFYVMAVLSETRVVRVLCMVMPPPCRVSACVCVGVAGGAIILVAVGSGLGRGCVFVLDGVPGGLAQWLVVV
jgi:hypothetical protein